MSIIRPTPVKPGFLSSFNRSQSEDPLKVFDWILEVEGFAAAGFTKCTGLSAETEVIKYPAGGGAVRKSPGITDYPDIVLERGQILAAGAGNSDFMLWYKQVHDISLLSPRRGRNTIRRTMELVQTDAEGTEVLRWRVEECWPSKFKPMSDLDLGQSADSIGSITIVNEGFSLITPLFPI